MLIGSSRATILILPLLSSHLAYTRRLRRMLKLQYVKLSMLVWKFMAWDQEGTFRVKCRSKMQEERINLGLPVVVRMEEIVESSKVIKH